MLPPYQAHGHRTLGDVARRRQQTRFFVDLHRDNVVAVLIGDEQEITIGRQSEVTRMLATGWCVIDWSERGAHVLHRKHGDAVVPAVGSVNEAAVAGYADISTRAGGGAVVGQCRDRIQFFEYASCGVQPEWCHR